VSFVAWHRPLRDRPRRYLLVSVGTIFRTDIFFLFVLFILWDHQLNRVRNKGRWRFRLRKAVKTPIITVLFRTREAKLVGVVPFAQKKKLAQRDK
jgi:hypothetical protein